MVSIKSILNSICEDAENALYILNVTEMYTNILPNINKILRLMFTTSISSASNQQAFSKLINDKTNLRSTMKPNHLQNLMLLYTNKDILKIIDTRLLEKKWSHLKQYKIEV